MSSSCHKGTPRPYEAQVRNSVCGGPAAGVRLREEAEDSRAARLGGFCHQSCAALRHRPRKRAPVGKACRGIVVGSRFCRW